MAKINELLENKFDKIDYSHLLENHIWIFKERMNCIISPDSDGLLCGLFMSYYFNWEIVGYYDGKVLIVKKSISCFDDDVCFLDMEICREKVKSVGHHMLLYNTNQIPNDWNKWFKNCIQPNIIRNYDGMHTFRLKYPLATIHLLLAIIGNKYDIKIPESAICPLLFTDGTFNVLFSYPENVLNWLNFFDINNKKNPLRTLFLNERLSVFRLMQAMDSFFRKRDAISIVKERGDRLRISNTDGSPYNIENKNDVFYINHDAKNRIERFINILSDLTEWKYNEKNWCFSNMCLYKFTKGDFLNKKWNLTNSNYNKFIDLNPLSWAMTSGNNIEFTLEEPDNLP